MIAFAVPAMNCGYPRWFEPLTPGQNREPNAPENTGQFHDSFGHPLTRPRIGCFISMHTLILRR